MLVDREDVLNEIAHRFKRLFSASKEGYRLPDAERHRLEGFIQAFVFSGIITSQEATALMDKVYRSVFGMSIEEKRKTRITTWPEGSVDYSYFDIPLSIRKI